MTPCSRPRPLARRAAATVAAVLVALLVAAGCSGTGTSSDAAGGGSNSEPYRIFAVMSLSGPAGSAGTAQQRGLQAAVDVLNAQGGIANRQVEVEAVDDSGDPSRAVSLLRERLSSGAKPDLAVHGTTSTVALALLPVLTRERILSASFPADARIDDPQTFPYAFGATGQSTVQARGLAEAAIARRPRQVAVLVPDDAIGTTIGQTVRSSFEQAGVPYAFETFRTTDVDVTAQVQRLAATGPDLFVFSALGASASLVLQAVDRSQLTVPLLGDNQVSTAALTGVPQPVLDRLQVNATPVMVPRPAADQTAAFTSFLDALRRQGPIQVALNLYSHQWDMIQLVALATAQAGTTDPDAVKAALENLRQPAPADRPYVTFPEMGFSATDHFPSVRSGDYLLTPYTPLQDGRFQPAQVG